MFALAATLNLSLQAQIQTAGSLFVNVDATGLSPGAFGDITNSGTLGGFFETNGIANSAVITNLGGVNAILLQSGYMTLKDGIGGNLIVAPGGLLGTNPTASIEVWALNPATAADECMVAWGTRSNFETAFEYGSQTSGGAVQHIGSSTNDLPWDPVAQQALNNVGAPQNGSWHHLVYTYDGATQKVYIDGLLANSNALSFTNASSGIALGGQWTNSTTVGTLPVLATLALARVRIHDGALTAAQVNSNYLAEQSLFKPAPAFLTSLPVHRYSFNEAATTNADGLTFADSIGGANGTVQGLSTLQPAIFTGRRLVLPGGPTAANATSLLSTAAYGDLPNGLISTNSTNNGGTGEVSIEIWYQSSSSINFARIFDFGSISNAPGGELTSPGNYPVPGVAYDYLYFSQNSTGVNGRRLSWSNGDPLPAGSTTNSGTPLVDEVTTGSYKLDRHVVVTWKESTGVISAYDNGMFMGSITASNAMSALNDVNMWLGRSDSTDVGFVGQYDEVRFYTNVLTPSQVLGDYLVGPNTINTNQQAVSILTQPVNATAFQNNPVTFYVTASGSPAPTYQWNRNGSPISGATADTLTFTAGLTNNGDTYSVTVSNFANAVSNVVTSSTVTLAVTANLSLATQIDYTTRDGSRGNFTGTVGGNFVTGSTPAWVTHLGFYDANHDGLNSSHNMGILLASGGAVVLTNISPGTGGILVDGYRYIPLNPPVLLAANTAYKLQAQAVSGDGDPWPDTVVATTYNSYYVGTNNFATRGANFTTGAWPTPIPANGNADQIYALVNMAVLAMGPPQIVAMAPTNYSNYTGSSVILSVFVNGQAPVTVQWYKAPGTLLTGQTNLTLALNNLALGDSGDYFAIASNNLSTAQSSNATVTVLAQTIPIVIQQPQPAAQTVYAHQQATITVAAIGQQPLSYQWKFGATAIPGATNTSFTLTDAEPATAGNYSVTITNVLGSTNSATATITVLADPPGYTGSVILAGPAVYYPFSDVSTSTNAMNLGILGSAYNGSYQGTYSGVPGPQPPTYPLFDSNNLAFDNETLTNGGVAFPAITLTNTNGGPHVTMAAWVNKQFGQTPACGIIFSRAAPTDNPTACGFGVTFTGTDDQFNYTWNGAGNTFGFSSGLIVPNSQWCFMALVVEPTQATMYLQDGTSMKTATNFVTHTVRPVLSAGYVGWDTFNGIRRWFGTIDEPMIFDRALGAAEINSLYLAALVPQVNLAISATGTNVVVTWPSGTLQQSSFVSGPYSDLPSATSPYTNAATGNAQFFRVRISTP